MIYAIISDIHSNLPAVDAFLKEVEKKGAEKIIILGDICGKGPFPFEVLKRIKEIDTIAIKGNSDIKFLLNIEKKKLSEKKRELLEYLKSLPTKLWLDGRILLCHGSPQKITDYIYPSITKEALFNKLKGEKKPDVLLCGHSHIPFIKRVAGVLVVNSGSLGKPIDGDRRGSYAILNFSGTTKNAKIVRLTYDFTAIVDALKKSKASKKVIESYLSGTKNGG